jgi:porphobilinogen synthase
MVQETHLTPANLIWPIFVKEGTASVEPIASMPGVERVSIDLAVAHAERIWGSPALRFFQ